MEAILQGQSDAISIMTKLNSVGQLTVFQRLRTATLLCKLFHPMIPWNRGCCTSNTITLHVSVILSNLQPPFPSTGKLLRQHAPQRLPALG